MYVNGKLHVIKVDDDLGLIVSQPLAPVSCSALQNVVRCTQRVARLTGVMG